MFTIYWIDEAGQSSIEMGRFATREEAEAHIGTAWAELRNQGSEDDQTQINAGRMTIDDETAVGAE